MLAVSNCFAAGTSGNLLVSLGEKALEDEWGEYDSQVAAGFSFDIKGGNWPISLVIEQNGAADTDEVNNEDLVAVSSETSLGIRTYFNREDSTVIPFVGLGVSSFYASEERLNNGNDVIDDDDTGTGYWVGAGVIWKISGPFALGASVRHSQGDVNLFGRELDAGGTQVAVTARVWHW
jgi:opacity protein-like surface antigen